MTDHKSGSYSSSPTDAILEFLDELPSPFSEQLLVRLYGFFEDEVEKYSELGMEPQAVLLKLVGTIADEDYDFQRAILLIGALDYIFSQKKPWPPRITDKLMKAAGMPPDKAAYPIRDQPYLEAYAKWKKLRSKLSYFLLRKLDEKLSQSFQPDKT